MEPADTTENMNQAEYDCQVVREFGWIVTPLEMLLVGFNVYSLYLVAERHILWRFKASLF